MNKPIMKIILILVCTLHSAYFIHARGVYVKGNGNVMTEVRKTEDYDTVKVKGSLDIVLISGEEGTITIKGEENIIPYISIETRNKTLYITKTRPIIAFHTSNPFVITVPFEHINEISLEGSADITSEDAIEADEVSLHVRGSGDMRIRTVKSSKIHATVKGSGDIVVYALQSKDVLASIAGSGDILLRGTTKTFDGYIDGSGNIDANDLQSDDALMRIRGSGDATINAKDTLSAHIRGSGDIRYKGNPRVKVKSHVKGSGQIIHQN